MLQQFVLTADYAGGGGNMSIAPAINGVSGSPSQNVVTTANATAAITFANTASTATGLSLAFHPDAFTFATADLVMPGGVDMASRVVKDGITMRAVRQYSISDDTMPIRIDVLMGSRRACVRSWQFASWPIEEGEPCHTAEARSSSTPRPSRRSQNGITATPGGTRAAAIPLTAAFNRIAVCATAADSVALPPAVGGQEVTSSTAVLRPPRCLPHLARPTPSTAWRRQRASRSLLPAKRSSSRPARGSGSRSCPRSYRLALLPEAPPPTVRGVTRVWPGTRSGSLLAPILHRGQHDHRERHHLPVAAQ